MKKLVALLLSVAAVFAACGAGLMPAINGSAAYAAPAEKLVIYNWAQYIDEGDPDDERLGLLDVFEEYYYAVTGAALEIEYNTFETNEEVVTKALLSDAEMDLICPSEYTIEKLLVNGALRKINTADMQNAANVDQTILDTITEVFGVVEGNDGTKYDMTEYMVPYMWGTLGILYNTEFVTEEDIAEGYGILWNKANNPNLNKKILMKDSVRDSYVAALLYAKEQGRLPAVYENYSVQELINTVNEDLLKVAEMVLLEQRNVFYEVDFGKDDMVQGNAYVDLAWSGDAIYAIEEGDYVDVTLDYYVPEIGGNIWFDGWVIPKGVKNLRAAEMFIDFLCDPVNAIYNMVYIGYTSAIDKNLLAENEDVLAILEYYEYDADDFFADTIRYPELTENLGVMRDFGDKADDAIMMWESIKPSKTTELVTILAIIIGLGALAVGAYLLYDFLKLRPRKIIE